MTMTPFHPLWSKFTDRLWDTYTDCDSSAQFPATRRLLQELGYTDADIKSSISLFRTMGAFCDCHLLHNLETLFDSAPVGRRACTNLPPDLLCPMPLESQ